MPTGGVIAALTPFVKRTYTDPFVETLTWSKGTLAAMIRKKKADGQPTWAMRIGNSPARSASYPKAAAKSEAYYTRGVQPRIDALQADYARATIEGKVLAITGNQIGRFYDKFVGQIDGIMDATMQSFSTKIYRAGWGCIGRIAAAVGSGAARTCDVTTTTLTLRQREDIVNFEVNADLVFSSSENAATLRNSGATLRIAGLDPSTGNLTMAAAINTVTGTTNGDYIFVDGDRQNSATPTRQCIAGMDDWFMTAAPTPGESFFNLDRSTDGRLRPTIIDCTSTGAYAGANEEQALIAAVSEVRRFQGGNAGNMSVFINDTRMQNLQVQAMGRYRPAVATGPGKIGFKGIELNVGGGSSIEVYPDAYCPLNKILGLNMDSVEVVVGKDGRIPGFIDWDGNTMLRQTDADGIECRVGYYAEVRCNAPIKNFVIDYGNTFGV